jgi:hypothetical protein
MRKRVPQESQATKEVSVTFIQDGANTFEDWLDEKHVDFGFNAPSLSNVGRYKLPLGQAHVCLAEW